MKPLFKAYLVYLGCLLVILGISYVITIFWGNAIRFNIETLRWFTSTLAQTFGALLAIVVAVALHHRAVTLDWIRRKRKVKQADVKTFLEKEDKILSSIFIPLASMANVIIISLAVLANINSSVSWSQSYINYFFILLFIYSSFALMALVFRIGEVFTH